MAECREIQESVVLSLFAGRPLDEKLAAAADARAFRTDEFRAGRLTQAVLERFPVGAAMLLSRPSGLATALAFATSPEFAGVVRKKRCLVTSAAAYLCRTLVGWSGSEEVIALESALCGRQETKGSPPAGKFVMAPGCTVLRLSNGFVSGYARVLESLGGADAIGRWELLVATRGRVDFRLLQQSGEPRDWLVVAGSVNGPGSVEALDEPLLGLMQALRVPRTVVEVASMLGDSLPLDEADEVLEGLVEDGLVVAGAS